ncbi:MAG: mechanosensitive ion channel [Sphingobacteriales bacterium]|nr:mechanosensitive ion channel [Sphingobacteriales bacterium]MBI3720549.1 mechanosensitive ion channel [Sphingobacteriales bacterium]
MNDFLSRVILDNTIKQYLVVIGIIWVVYIFKKYLSRAIADLSFRLFSKTSALIRKEPFKSLVAGPVQLFLMILVVFTTLNTLNFPKAMDFTVHKIPIGDIIDSIGAAIVIIAFIWLLLRMIDFIALVMQEKASLTADLSDDQLIVFFKDFFKIIIVVIGVLLVIRFSFHKEVGPLLTGLSIVGAALALAAKESLENLIASFIIFFDKPFTLGDLVKVQTVTGTVEKIGLRSTRIRTDAKTFVTVPNKQMVDSILDNLSLRTQRKGELRLELNPQTAASDVQKLIDSINSLLKNNYDVGLNGSTVFLTDVNKNGIVVLIEYFTENIDINVFNNLRQRLNFDVLKLMEQQEIKMVPVRNDSL